MVELGTFDKDFAGVVGREVSCSVGGFVEVDTARELCKSQGSSLISSTLAAVRSWAKISHVFKPFNRLWHKLHSHPLS